MIAYSWHRFNGGNYKYICFTRFRTGKGQKEWSPIAGRRLRKEFAHFSRPTFTASQPFFFFSFPSCKKGAVWQRRRNLSTFFREEKMTRKRNRVFLFLLSQSLYSAIVVPVKMSNTFVCPIFHAQHLHWFRWPSSRVEKIGHRSARWRWSRAKKIKSRPGFQRTATFVEFH